MTLHSLSLVVPAYNEEGSLEKVVRDLLRVAPECAHVYEIVIVDDGSSDRTPEIADRLARETPAVRVVHHPGNRGFGAAFRTGVESSRFEHVSLVPADGQFPAGDLPRFVPLADADIVVGFRTHRPDRPMRRLSTLILRGLMVLAFGITARDINWVKLYRRDLFTRIRPEYSGIGIDAEIMVKAVAVGARIRETRVGYLPRLTGVATGGQPGRVFRTVLEIARLWWRRCLGRL